jgi:hypothetical protein
LPVLAPKVAAGSALDPAPWLPLLLGPSKLLHIGKQVCSSGIRWHIIRGGFGRGVRGYKDTHAAAIHH